MENEKICIHHYVYQDTQKKCTITGYEHEQANFHKIDKFFCNKCLDIKCIEKKESVNLPFGGSRNVSAYAPIWY